MNNNPIGLFDSGVGGLTILNQLYKSLPNESFIYVGDTARAPYGDRDFDNLYQINLEIISFLKKKPIKLLVMACNTSCANFLDMIQKTVTIPVIELIGPVTKYAALATKNNRIAVLATTGTINSHVYKHRLLSENPALEVLELACPKLVPLVESGQIDSPEGHAVAQEYLADVQAFQADTLIYGCSHYPYFEPIFKKICPEINYIDPASTLAPVVKEYLSNQHLLGTAENNRDLHFYISGDCDRFQTFLNSHFSFNNHQVMPYLDHTET